MVKSCLVFVLLAVWEKSGPSGRTFSGVRAEYLNALPGAITLVGELRLLGTKVPWSDSPERGGPSTPRCSSQSCAVFVVWDLVRLLENLSGECREVCCFGTSVLFRLPFKLLAP